MKRLIVMILIVSLATAGTAWAQVAQVLTPTTSSVQCDSTLPRKVLPVSAEQWYALSVDEQRELCRANLSGPDAPNQVTLPRQMVSPKLAVAGTVSMLAGAGLLFHWGESNVRVLGDTYCVSDTGSYVDAGSCGGPTQRQIGLMMVGAGVVLAWIGFRTKTFDVHPILNPSTIGASTTIRWGGTHAK